TAHATSFSFRLLRPPPRSPLFPYTTLFRSQVYRSMVLTRGIEERGHILYRQGKIPGSFYTGRGNEAASVGVATAMGADDVGTPRSEEHTSELQSRFDLVCRLLLEKKKKKTP